MFCFCEVEAGTGPCLMGSINNPDYIYLVDSRQAYHITMNMEQLSLVASESTDNYDFLKVGVIVATSWLIKSIGVSEIYMYLL